MAQYGFKKGHSSLKKTTKKIYVFKFVGVFEGTAGINEATGIDPVKIQYLAKSEKMKDGFIYSYNERPGQRNSDLF